MTNPSAESKHPKRDLLLSLWESVLREQLPEGMYPWWQRLNALARAWPSQDSDGEAQGFVDALGAEGAVGASGTMPPPETAFYLRRALALTRLLDQAFATDPIDPPWSDDVQLPFAEKVAAELKAAGMRPLRARQYPPFPQLQVLSTTALNSTLTTEHSDPASEALFCELSSMLRNWDPDPTPECPRGLSMKIRGRLVRQWQSTFQTQDCGGQVSPWYSLFTPFSLLDVPVSTAALNDSFANTAHIDPRFANFIPFATGQLLATVGSSGPSSSQWLFSSVELAADALDGCLARHLIQLSTLLSIDAKFARYGSRALGLHARLSLGNPELAPEIERENLSRHLAQCVQHILCRLNGRSQLLRGSLSTWKESASLTPNSIPELPPPNRGVAYTSSSQLLLDLKQLHQAVGEVYGGVAFTPAVRRALILAGLTRLHGNASNLNFDASSLEDVASEVGLRAGLLRQPLTAMPESAATEAALALAANPAKLASTFDAGSLSDEAIQTLGFLRAARWLLANLDPEAVNCIIVTNVSQPSEAIAALALMKAMDAEPLHHCNTHGNGLADRVGLVIGVNTTGDADSNARLVRSILDAPPFGTYAQSRGGHIEVMLQRAGGELSLSAFPSRPSTLDLLRLRAHARAIIGACRGTTVTFTLATTDAWSIDRLIACFPPDTVNQHLRVIAPSDTARLLTATTHAVRQLFDAPLAELTRQSWLNREAEPPEAVEQEREALAAIEAAWAALLAQHGDAGVTPDSHAEWFEAIAPWFGARHLMGLADSRFVATAFGIVADSMQRMHPRRLSTLAWRTLPKGAYSRLYPGVEQAWRDAADAVRASGQWPETPTLSQIIDNGDALLSRLPIDE